MLTPSQQQRLAAAAHSAVLCERASGLPAGITLAQSALESARGASAPGNNCSGTKAYPGCQAQEFVTHEAIAGEQKTLTLEFAAFNGPQECFEKHARLNICGEPSPIKTPPAEGRKIIAPVSRYMAAGTSTTGMQHSVMPLVPSSAGAQCAFDYG
jgi:hypothetical protein